MIAYTGFLFRRKQCTSYLYSDTVFLYVITSLPNRSLGDSSNTALYVLLMLEDKGVDKE